MSNEYVEKSVAFLDMLDGTAKWIDEDHTIFARALIAASGAYPTFLADRVARWLTVAGGHGCPEDRLRNVLAISRLGDSETKAEMAFNVALARAAVKAEIERARHPMRQVDLSSRARRTLRVLVEALPDGLTYERIEGATGYRKEYISDALTELKGQEPPFAVLRARADGGGHLATPDGVAWLAADSGNLSRSA
jgi:hypothetical protein